MANNPTRFHGTVETKKGSLRVLKRMFPGSMNEGNYHHEALSMPAALHPSYNGNQTLRSLSDPVKFSVGTLCAAIQNKCNIDTVKSYIKSYANSAKTKATIATDG